MDRQNGLTMPGRTLPVISPSELQRHKTASSCYVTLGSKVFDITAFLNDHPGGGDLILEYAGRDVREIMEDVISHAHSEAAYEVLDDHLVGFLEPTPHPATSKGTSHAGQGRSSIYAQDGPGPLPESQLPLKAMPTQSSPVSSEDLSVDTDATLDYRTHKFLDLNRPLLMQVWNGGFSKDFYLTQVHRPRHYKSGESAPLFGNFLEPLSKTPWWVIPSMWLPLVAYGTVIASQGLPSWLHLAGFWLTGLAAWTLIEYGMHRCLFHIDSYLPDNRLAITTHFLLHGIHHYLPMDKLRLVMPPALLSALATPFWKLAHLLFFWNWHAATAAYCGGFFGYICYDVTHYFLHHRKLPAYYRELKSHHLRHHYSDYQNGFGVSNRFWDRVFGTDLPPPKAAKAA